MIELKFDGKSKNYKFRCSREEKIIQNVGNIISRIKGNIPLNREKGIDSFVIDEDIAFVEAALSAFIIEEIDREEPRFDVREVEFNHDFQEVGKLDVIIRGGIREE